MSREEPVRFERARFSELLGALERMAAGELEHSIPISPERDELDAVAHGINVMAGELLFRLSELHQMQGSLIQSGKLAALGEVSSGLAHELNNPLTIIRGYLEQIQELIRRGAGRPVDATELERFLGKLDQSVERMSAIIRHIMDFSRQSRPLKRGISLNDVIRRSFILIGEQLRLRNIRLEVALCADSPRTLGDDLRLEQAFINVLTNARDAITEAHGDHGGTIRVESRIGTDTWLEVEISDDGTGMSDEIQEKIFNPFFTTKEVGQGTGLGLSITLGILQEHAGSIECRSRRKQGTAILIRLPQLTQEEA